MYLGDDLIFATGAPGSRWSRLLTLLSIHPSINSSDNNSSHYSVDIRLPSGKTAEVGSHSGAYFGPNNEFGEMFTDLTKLSVDIFLEEIKRPFKNWETGIKIIKSHWFSYGDNLEWLYSNFPNAKFILIYSENSVAFKWWHVVGGWSIHFPVYTWYKDNKQMFEKISEENLGIVKFASKHLVPIAHYDFLKILQILELSNDLLFFDSLSETECATIKRKSTRNWSLEQQINRDTNRICVGILTPTSNRLTDINEFNQCQIKMDQFKLQLHASENVDEILQSRHGKAWLAEINSIIAKK